MKKLIFYYAFFLLAVMLMTFVSCSKDGSNPVNTTKNGFFTAKVDGKDFAADPLLSGGSYATIAGEPLLSFFGRTAAGQAISISGNVPKPGTYVFDETTEISASYYEDFDAPSISTLFVTPNTDGIAGEVTFTEISNKRVKGTIYFTGTNGESLGKKKVITEGKFDITLY